MSTVSSLYDLLQYRPDIQAHNDDLIHIVNAAVRAVAKRLYFLDSSLVIDEMEVKVFASVNTYELMTLDVAPATAWAAGDTITGQTSGETCVIKSVITPKTFYVDERSGTFTLGEVLTNGTSEADQGAANPTFASAMVIVDSSPDTITYVAAQFVVEGFQADMPVSMTQADNTGTYRLNAVAAGTLTFDSAETLTAALSSSFIITSDASFGYLPSDFWGLRQNFEPYIDGKTYPLKPLPGQREKLAYVGPGDPVYYKIKGNRLYVVPETASDYTIKGDYYKRPTALTASTDTLPFYELFDEVIADYIETYFRGPLTKTATMVQILDKLVADGVDAVAARYDRKGPTHFPGGIQWGF